MEVTFPHSQVVRYNLSWVYVPVLLKAAYDTHIVLPGEDIVQPDGQKILQDIFYFLAP